MIPVRNVYYMLAYAFKALRSEGYANLAVEPFDNVAELLSAILVRGIDAQVRRGLAHTYEERSEPLGTIRGKVEFAETFGTGLPSRRKVVCEHDELTTNAYFNRILKTAALMLLEEPLGDKRGLRSSLRYLDDVSPLDPRRIEWRQRYTRSTATYRMLVNVCRMAIEGALHSSGKGAMKLERFLDEARMSALYERFVFEYFRQEHDDIVSVSAPYIPWVLDGGEAGMLPTMRTDVVLQGRGRSSNRTLIIDAKYYAHNTQSHFGVKSVHSGNLYQMFTYVKNETERQARSGKKPDVCGLILYAKTDDDIQPNGTWGMSGNEISASALDLAADFSGIASQLDGIIGRYFG